jgi:hypothetical protein
MNDFDLGEEFFRTEREVDETRILVRTISWKGPHTPVITWVLARTLRVGASDMEVEAAIQQLLRDPKFFRVCEECSRRYPIGHMHDETSVRAVRRGITVWCTDQPREAAMAHADTYMESLSHYYDQVGINPLDFSCAHRDECERACAQRGWTFTEATAALVGRAYGNGVPRLVFVSSDPVDVQTDPSRRTLHAERETHAQCPVRSPALWDKTWMGQHWYQTHLLAWTLLRPFVRKPFEVQGTCEFFAHTRAVRCSNSVSDEAPKVLYRNCRDHLLGELRVLEPDVIVTQGRKAEREVRHMKLSFVSIAPSTEQCGHAIVTLGSRQVLWLQSYHPSPRARRYYIPQKERCWPLWTAALGEFWAKRH